MNYQV
jgi:hypothetical protein